MVHLEQNLMELGQCSVLFALLLPLSQLANLSLDLGALPNTHPRADSQFCIALESHPWTQGWLNRFIDMLQCQYLWQEYWIQPQCDVLESWTRIHTTEHKGFWPLGKTAICLGHFEWPYLYFQGLWSAVPQCPRIGLVWLLVGMEDLSVISTTCRANRLQNAPVHHGPKPLSLPCLQITFFK